MTFCWITAICSVVALSLSLVLFIHSKKNYLEAEDALLEVKEIYKRTEENDKRLRQFMLDNPQD